MTTANFALWIVGDIFLGLLHLIIFGLRLFFYQYPPATSRYRAWLEFLARGILFAYTVTLLAANLGQLCRAWYEFGVRDPGQKLACLLVSLGGFILILVSSLCFSFCDKEGLPQQGNITLRSEKSLAIMAGVVAMLGCIIAFLAHYFFHQIIPVEVHPVEVHGG